MKKTIRCRFGLHTWTPWQVTEQGNINRHRNGQTVVIGNYKIQEKDCEHCHILKTRVVKAGLDA